MLGDAYRNWLSCYKWDWFVTLGFPTPVSVRKAERQVTAWIKELRREAGGKHFRYVRVLHRYDHGDNIQYELLIGGLKRKARMARQTWEREWARTGGWAVMETYDRRQNGFHVLLRALHPYLPCDIEIHMSEPLQVHRLINTGSR